MKVNFIRKAVRNELIPQDEFVIEKEIILGKDLFDTFLNNPLNDYDFIKENVELMYIDENEVYHCIFVTANEYDFGILIESEGYSYARYSSYYPKMLLAVYHSIKLRES